MFSDSNNANTSKKISPTSDEITTKSSSILPQNQNQQPTKPAATTINNMIPSTTLKDINVQFFPCKICGAKFPSYYFVHKHKKIWHPEAVANEAALNNIKNCTTTPS